MVIIIVYKYKHTLIKSLYGPRRTADMVNLKDSWSKL